MAITYSIAHHQVIVTIAIQVFIHHVNVQLFMMHMRLHAWIKRNRTVSVQTDDDIFTTQRLLRRLFATPVLFNVNANYN